MSEKPQTGPHIQAFAKKIEETTGHIVRLSDKGKPRDYEQEARWYVAYWLADQMNCDYRTKDWAHFVLEGMQPLTDEDVQEFFFPEQEEGDNDPQGYPTEKELLKWFGVKWRGERFEETWL